MPVPDQYKNDVGQPLEPGRQWAILISVSITGETSYLTVPVNMHVHTWKSIPISHKLGFPMKAAVWRYSEHHFTNQPLECLTVYAETESVPMMKWTGDVVITRADGKGIQEEQVMCLLDYVKLDHNLAVMAAAMENRAEERQNKEQMIEQKLTPEYFHAYFKEWKNQWAKQGKHQLAISPVEVTYGVENVAPACGTCGHVSLESDLARCSVCKDRHYCDKQCQMKDWKDHKRVCTQTTPANTKLSAASDAQPDAQPSN